MKALQIGDRIARIPIIQGGMGVGVSRSSLAGAVAKVPYCITKALVNAVKGDLDHGLIFCGADIGRIKKLMSVHDLMQELQPEG